jgi:hypothetical protein
MRSCLTTLTWSALYVVWYNFCRIYKSLRVSPGMSANVSDRLWSMDDVAEMIEARLTKPGKRGPYKQRAAEE